jgi:hypothetical protein
MPRKIEVLAREVRLSGVNEQDYVCLTDIARYKDPERTDYLIFNWLRNRNTLEFLGLWEQINNPGFNPIEFDGIRKQAGLNSFILTAKQWIERTGAIGIESKAGRYGGTYAHLDIALEFAAWISVEFKLYLIKLALFGLTAAQRRGQNPGEKGNIRDQATSAQLVCLSNLENLNALFIGQALPQSERLSRLNQIAIQQMKLLTGDNRLPELPDGEKRK